MGETASDAAAASSRLLRNVIVGSGFTETVSKVPWNGIGGITHQLGVLELGRQEQFTFQE